jgi:LytS/YehU family sensor histidine kinase
VDTQDDRASSLLTALTGYLRATLPMFKRPTLALHEELLAVERYLQVMQARMGKRLTWQIDAAPELRDLALPPGVLLTLVENAILHGLEPLLAGGEVRLSAQVRGNQAHLDVVDNGCGLDDQAADGVGLSNIRQRLALACGDSAKLELRSAPPRGVWAHLELPWPKART